MVGEIRVGKIGHSSDHWTIRNSVPLRWTRLHQSVSILVVGPSQLEVLEKDDERDTLLKSSATRCDLGWSALLQPTTLLAQLLGPAVPRKHLISGAIVVFVM